MDSSRGRRIQSRSPDRETTDGILSGTIGPQDAPTEWRPVAELLTVLRTLPATTPGAGAAATGVDPGTDRDRRTVQAMATVLAGAQAHKAWRRHLRVPFRPSVPRPLNVYRVRLATALVAASLAFMVGLASAGRLPGPAQDAVSVALSKFGITVPRGDQSGKTTPVGPDLSGPEKKGLCNAFFAGKGNEENGKADSNSVAFKKLQDAADETGQSVNDFCADELPEPTATPATGEGKGHGNGKDKAKDKDHKSQSDDQGSNGNGHGSDHSSNGHGSDDESQDE
ncbi:MAG TPA: hypothetical protein VF986_01665 [Actinomycetota bacterium]